jgi:hypothetical protein
MFVDDETALASEAARRLMLGDPTDSIADRVGAEKILDFGAARARLRLSGGVEKLPR